MDDKYYILQKIGQRAPLRLLMQHLVRPIVGGCAAEKLLKELIIVAGIIEAHGERQFRDGTEILFRVHQFFCGFVNPVFHQIFKRAHLQGSRKAAAAFAFADVDAVGDFLQGQRLRVMGPDIEHGLFDALLVLRHTRRRGRFRLWKLAQQLRLEMAEIPLGGDFIAKMFCHIYLDRFHQCLQHTLVPGRALIQKKYLKKLVVLQRQQILRLQIIAFMPENIIRMKDKGMKGTLLFILRVNTVHDVLVDNKPLPRSNQIRVVVRGNFRNALIDDQDFHLFMPVPANPVQVRLVQIEIAGVDRVVQRSVIVFGIQIVISIYRILG